MKTERIAARLRGHDFAGEVLDDAWADAVMPRAMEYLTSQEITELEAGTYFLVADSFNYSQGTSFTCGSVRLSFEN